MKINTIYLNILIAIIGLIASIHPAQPMNDGSRYAGSSVLSKGNWTQLRVTENAVYKLTYEDLKNMKIDDPAKVKIYGYGGWVLDQDFTKPFVDDLPEVAVYMNKGSDNVFGPGDFLLFYGRGPVKWTYNSTTDIFEHQNNPYSTYGTYFVTESEQGPKELPSQDSYAGGGATVNTFDDYLIHERDSIAILHSGRELFGESFVGKNTWSFSYTVPGITSDAGKVRLSFVAATKTDLPVSLSVGDTQLTLNVSPISGDYVKAFLANGMQEWTGEKKEQFTVSVSYNPNGQLVANLNYFTLNMKRRLRFYDNGFTLFRNKESLQSDVKYVIENAGTQCQVWNITGNFDAKLVKTVQEGNNLSFGAEKNTVLQEYVLVDASKSFPTPEIVDKDKKLKNQDLHALPATDMVIIAPEAYYSYAEKLAEKHKEQQGFRVSVVQPEWIYNEFSSGTPDASAYRRFMKMFYDRAENEEDRPKYLLLYGDGFFDNRHLTADGLKMNPKYYLLTYQFVESLDETHSYGTDDYFGFLDDDEGLSLGQDKLDIGIGRFPVSSVEQAENALNKVINYMENKDYSLWKNTVIFTADDTGTDAFCSFAKLANSLADYMENNHPQYMVTKSYMDAFQAADLNGKKTYPDAKSKLLNTMKTGCFLMNYTGHGSPTSMSAEDMMNIRDIRQMSFENHLPIWITATCDFGRFDEVATSAGEEVFLNKKSAGIALYTTTRVVYSSGNQTVNEKLIRNIFSKTNGKHATLGDIIRQSKSEIEANDFNKLNFVLLGDPALKLNYPEWEVVLDNINGVSVEEKDTINFRAMDKIKMEGRIVNEEGNIINDFTGNLQATVFDGKQTIESVTTQTINGEKTHWTFTDYSNAVYKGNNAVENGRFSVSFTIPKDISYTTDQGKMNFYASDKTNHRDAAGSFLNYTLSGTNDDFDPNKVGPEIRYMFLNTESFRDGDNVNESPFFHARVSDENGINMAGSGLGHDITICIDRNPVWTYPLNEYYQPENDTAGMIGFPIPELPAGKHELALKVWDIQNNSSSDTLRFNVIKGLKPELFDIDAWPNPAKVETFFHLTHNRPETTMEVEIRVYDLMGRSIWTYQQMGSSGYLQTLPIEWTLNNNGGRRVSPGIYIYQAIIKTPEGEEATKSKKLIVQ
jgi:hypothetical protein